jgi:co-chaperonin GroES (HSP10)
MRIIPNGKKLLVKPIKAEEEEVGGIVVPPSVATANLSRGIVVEVGDGLLHKFKEGDMVIYSSGAGQAQRYKGEWHLWLTEREFDSDIWGKEIV